VVTSTRKTQLRKLTFGVAAKGVEAARTQSAALVAATRRRARTLASFASHAMSTKPSATHFTIAIAIAIAIACLAHVFSSLLALRGDELSPLHPRAHALSPSVANQSIRSCIDDAAEGIDA